MSMCSASQCVSVSEGILLSISDQHYQTLQLVKEVYLKPFQNTKCYFYFIYSYDISI